jgi:hypothetical protein
VLGINMLLFIQKGGTKLGVTHFAAYPKIREGKALCRRNMLKSGGMFLMSEID